MVSPGSPLLTADLTRARRGGWVILLILLMFASFDRAMAGDLGMAAFDRLVADLNSNSFPTRQAASKALTSYVDPSSGTRLTIAQLQTLRDLAHGTGSPSLEVQYRAGKIIQSWMQLNPATTKEANDFLKGLEIKNARYDNVLNEGSFTLGGVKIAYEAAVIPFVQQLTSDYWRAVSQYGDGLTNNVVPRLEAMKKLVQGLTDQQLRSLFISMGGNQLTKAQLVDYLDMQIKTAKQLINKVNNKLGDPPPGPAKPLPVRGTGAIGNAKTFQVALVGTQVTPGKVTFLGLSNDFAIAAPPTGYEFVGDIFVLAKSNKLQLTGGQVDVSIDYGDPALIGLPTSDAKDFQLVRFADGVYEPFLSTSNDTSNFVLSGVYDIPSSGSGLDPFGEFAVIVAVPEPGSWMLLAAGFAVVGFASRVRNRRLTIGTSRSREKATCWPWRAVRRRASGSWRRRPA